MKLVSINRYPEITRNSRLTFLLSNKHGDRKTQTQLSPMRPTYLLYITLQENNGVYKTKPLTEKAKVFFCISPHYKLSKKESNFKDVSSKFFKLIFTDSVNFEHHQVSATEAHFSFFYLYKKCCFRYKKKKKINKHNTYMYLTVGLISYIRGTVFNFK